MSNAIESTDLPQADYGNYILRTGDGMVAEIELAYGRHWYRTRFANRKPILDLGPGRCWFTKQKVDDIVAVDNSVELVEHYRGEGINIHRGDAYCVPFVDGYFDGIFCCWLFEHLLEPARALLEIRRVMRAGGYACIVVPSPNDIAAFYDDYTHIRPFTPISLRQLAMDTGFTTFTTEYLPWMRGVRILLQWGGPRAVSRYFGFSEKVARKFNLVNRNHLMLELWK
jgi:SAM-dependent methyltransferase